MARPEQLQNQIYGAYGQGVTGFDYDQVGRSLEKDREYKREELKNFYDIQADLDAAQVSSLKGTLDEMYKGIDTNELRVGSEEFQRQVSKLKSQAVGLQETKQLAEDALKAVNENPDSMVYMTTDANGQPIAGGYNEIMKQFTDVTNRSYQDPQAYNSTINSMLGNFRPKVSEDEVFTNIKTAVDAQVEKQLKEYAKTEADLNRLKIAYRKGKLTSKTPIDQKSIVQNIKAGFGDQLTMLYAQERGMGGLAEDMDKETFQDQYAKSLIPTQVVEEEDYTVPAPPRDSTESSRGLKSRGSGRFENEDFAFVVTEAPTSRERSSKRGERQGLSGNIKVVPKDKGEPLRTFSDEDGDILSGRLSEVYMEAGQPMLKIRTASDDFEEIPLGDNFPALEEFYGISEEDIRYMVNSMSEGGRTVTSTPEGTMKKFN